MATWKKVLILDPSPIFRRTLKQVVQTCESKVDVIEAESAKQAVDFANNTSLDVVFIDIALPNNNGIELIGTIKKLIPDVKIIVLTSHDSVEHKEASLRKGADFFLSKVHSGGLRLIEAIQKSINPVEIA